MTAMLVLPRKPSVLLLIAPVAEEEEEQRLKGRENQREVSSFALNVARATVHSRSVWGAKAMEKK